MIEVLPFKMTDLDSFKQGGIEDESFGDVNFYEMAENNHWTNHAVTVKNEQEVLGFVTMKWAKDNVYISFLLSDSFRKLPLFLTKFALNLIKKIHDMDIKIIAEAHNNKAKEWLLFLGFKEDKGVFVHW